MIDLDGLRRELHEGLENLRQEEGRFLNDMLDKIDKAEKSMVLEMLGAMNNRLGAIEEKLAERDRDKKDGAGDDDLRPKVKDHF